MDQRKRGTRRETDYRIVSVSCPNPPDLEETKKISKEIGRILLTAALQPHIAISQHP